MSRKRDDYEEYLDRKNGGLASLAKRIKSPLSALDQATLHEKMAANMSLKRNALLDTKDADLHHPMKLATISNTSAEVCCHKQSVLSLIRSATREKFC